MPSIISALLAGTETWGVTEEEKAAPFAVDELGMEGASHLYRGVTVNAPAPVVFRWLLQLKAAPYSYDLLDNFGRQSPRELTPGLENLEAGQTFMFIFNLAGWTPDKSVTLRLKPFLSPGGFMGDTAISYDIRERDEGGVRLLAKIAVRYAWGPFGWPTRLLLPSGDLVMMRKQLLTLKELAEGQSQTPPAMEA